MGEDTESSLYNRLGASSSKAGVLKAVGAKTPSHFIEFCDDVCDDPNYQSFLHADGAGTKSIVAYLAYRETNDPTWFRSLAFDSLVMNLDDVICAGIPETLILSNTIGRNKALIPDEAISAIINGYKDLISNLKSQGISISLCGGETADVGDLVRTCIVDSTLYGRIKKSNIISTDSIKAGDIIIGLSSTGKATYETENNSSIGSNGLTLARHALINQKYAQKYPEILDPNIPKESSYCGKYSLLEPIANLSGISIAKALLSPTRTYAPVIKKILDTESRELIHGIIHCTGGGQTKALRFGKNVRYVKNDLFPCPAVFQLIKQSLNVPWKEMYSVFNMGHRMEIYCAESVAASIIAISKSFGIEAKKIGYVAASKSSNTLCISSPESDIEYSN
ncbi:MAG: AIR synthase-related protein [bacterium]|nr:AIR synthase-related protein [bacterium]